MDTTEAYRYGRPDIDHLNKVRQLIANCDFVQYTTSDTGNEVVLLNQEALNPPLNTATVAEYAVLLDQGWTYIGELLNRVDALTAGAEQASRSKHQLIERLVEMVKEMGEERDFCADGMSHFISSVTGMSQSDVLDRWFLTTSNLRVVLDIEVEHGIGDYSAHDLLDLDERSLARWLEGNEANSLTVDVAEIEWA